MKMKKSNLAIIILAVIFASSGIINIIIAIIGGFPKPIQEKKILIIGFDTNPEKLDPVDTRDVSSFQIQQQVVQGLIQYNVSDHPNYPIIPVLATNWTWVGADHIDFELRQGVKFHDGTDWDADAAIWNLQRLMWFSNYTGTLPVNATSWLGLPSSLYFASDGETPYIENFFVSKINQFSIAIDLSFDFAPFLDLLCFPSSFMCSPTSTPKYSYLNITHDVLVGTGPYKMDFDGDGNKDDGEGIQPNVEVRFRKNEDFWGENEVGWKKPFSKCAEIVVFDINEDDVSRNTDMFVLDIDYLLGTIPDMIDIFNESEYHTVKQVEELNYGYLSFYCNDYNPTAPPSWTLLNVTWRKALQFAINYTHIVDEIFQEPVVRGPLVVCRSMPGYNASADANKITMNFTSARLIMQSMGFGVGWDTAYPGANEFEWSAASFRTVRVNEIYSDTINQELNLLLLQNWDLIGVDIDITVRTSEDFYNIARNTPWVIDVALMEWRPDYLDAYSILEPLFSNTSYANICRMNDPYMMTLLSQALLTTSAVARQQIYMHIQSKYFDATTPDHEWKYPHAPLYANLNTYVHSADLNYTAYNTLSDLWTWEMYLRTWEEA
jgi:peptide/nickel transport system substrate-binding protein